MSVWRSIASAPKDGTNILVHLEVASQPVVHIAWYRSKDEWEESGKYCGGWDTLEEWEGWWSYTEGSISQSKLDGHYEPKYWMPYEPPQLPAKEV
jgi:hypothetical protein